MKTGLQKLEDILDGQTYWELDELTDLIHDMAKKERDEKPPLMSMDTKTGEVTIVNEQKPTANADLWSAIAEFVSRRYPEPDGCDAAIEVREILSKYRPVKEVKEQGEAWLRQRELTNDESASVHKFVMDKFTPAPVASGLRDEIEAICRKYTRRADDKPWVDMLKRVLSRHPSTPQAEKVDRTEELVGRLRTWISGFEASINHQKNGDDEVYCFFTEDDIREFTEILADYDKGAK